MIAGTLARLEEPAEDPLESATATGDMPAVEVEDSQETFDGRTVQWGTAADRVAEPREDVTVTDRDGRVDVRSSNVTGSVEVTTEWVADVEASGMLVAASVRGDSDTAFPFGLFGAQADRMPERLNVDVGSCKREWRESDCLKDVTMAGDGDPESTSLNYGAAAGRDSPTSIGIGFEIAWNGDIVTGVVWESGYVRTDFDLAERFVQFVLEEIWPHCYGPEDDEEEGEQTTLGEATGDDVRECIRCGETEDQATIVELLDEDVCLTCNDAWQEDRWSMEEVTDGA